MTNTTEETWKVGSTILNTYAYNIETISGREGIPPRRGENVVIPYRDGRMWVPKYFDERPLTLRMWVRHTDVDGNEAGTATARRAQLRDNTQALKDLFGIPAVLLSLERKIRLGSGLATWTAQAECRNTLDFEWLEGHTTFAKFVAELVMPDPYWYDGATKKL